MLERIKAIFYRPEFFRSQSFTTNQAISFYSLTVLVVVGIMLLAMLPGAFTFVESVRSGEWQAQKAIVQNLYPDDLKLTVKRDTITTNQNEPVVIPFPDAWMNLAECGPHRCKQNEVPANLLVIDTERPINRTDFATLDTVAILGAQEIGFQNPERGETRFFNLKELNLNENFTVTASMYREMVEKGFKVLQIGVFIFIFLVPGFLYVGYWVSHLFYALFGALIVWLAASMQGHKLRYGQAYRSTLYLLAAPMLVTVFISSMTGSRGVFLFTLMLFIMALVNFPKAEKLPDPVKIATADSTSATKDVEVEEERSK